MGIAIKFAADCLQFEWAKELNVQAENPKVVAIKSLLVHDQFWCRQNAGQTSEESKKK